ncbi:MAG TPA: sugar phosphate isomerase/epimerase family protein [Verrucomicrobiae bacterium]|jgi:sugar phosphate isomerase/epimerase|nr:sugar phosphate isomerase/epimerase family protein [Verrucomicrobiae bacterium]
MTPKAFSRRSFLAMSATLPWALRAYGATQIPVGLELYSVRNALKADPMGTVRAVAGLGYQCVEFYAPYFDWTESQTKDMRNLMDGLGIHCYSTHNDSSYLAPEKISRARDLNHILGCKYIVMSSSHEKAGLDGWKAVADSLNFAAEQLESSGLRAGYHNHQTEFTPIDGVRPMEILAKNTKPSVMLQLDVGTCIEAGFDPVAWIRANPGRIRSLHLKEWSPEPGKGYTVLFGEGVAKWNAIFEAAESVGGVEYYLIEQEGSRFSELDTAKRCLDAFRSTYHA